MGKKPLYRETDTGYGFVPPANWLDEETVASGSALAQGSKYDELRFAPVADKADLPRGSRRRRDWLGRAIVPTDETEAPVVDNFTSRNKSRQKARQVDTGIPFNWYPEVPSSRDVGAVRGADVDSSPTTSSRAPVRFMTQANLEDELGFDPVATLGQNFLINPEVGQRYINSTIPEADVVEIGIGPASLTAGIATKASRVIGLEIFPGYQDVQERNLAGHDNVEVRIQDALKFDFKRWADQNPGTEKQVMGNIPFHISEGLLSRLAKLGRKIDNITLLVGENLRDTIEASQNPHHDHYSRLAFVTSVYEVGDVTRVDKNDFWPAPPVDGGLVSLTPRECDPDGTTRRLDIRRQIVQNPDLAVGKIIQSGALVEPSSKNLSGRAARQYDRRQTKKQLITMARYAQAEEQSNGRTRFKIRLPGSTENDADYGASNQRLVRQINLSREILETPFNKLNNGQVQELAIALEDNL